MKIPHTSLLVEDQDKALSFYTEKLGFIKKGDITNGQYRWLTVVSKEEQEGVELVLEPMGFPPAKVYQKALFEAKRPAMQFNVDDVQKEYDRLLELGVVFSMKPTNMGPSTIAVFNDTCGNNIQLFQLMKNTLIAEALIDINATPAQVWKAMTTPKLIKEYLFGTDVSSDWKEGGAINYTGEYEGKKYHDKGIIKKMEPEKLLQTTYWSSMSGKEDKPENYNLVTYKLTKKGNLTSVTVSQDNISNKKEKEHSTENWKMVLNKLKEVVETEKA